MSVPGFWDHPAEAQKISQEVTSLRGKLSPWEKLESNVSGLQELVQLAIMENDESLVSEIEKDLGLYEKEFENLELQSLLSQELDKHNCFIYIHPGAGGTESCDWANMLLRMYLRWAENRGFETEVVDLQPGDEAGIRSATVGVKGEYAFGYLKSEVGVHRLVRISPFDSNKRRHTSFASVYVYPEIDDTIEIDIKEADLRIDTYRSSGAGGQHVNVTDSAIRITHIPTGIVVTCQNERSQHKNRATAMKILRARLYEKQLEEKRLEAEKVNAEKKDIAWGSQIRSYVFQPYSMIKDHRTGIEIGNVQSVMDGDINPFIEAYLRMNLEKGVKN